MDPRRLSRQEKCSRRNISHAVFLLLWRKPFPRMDDSLKAEGREKAFRARKCSCRNLRSIAAIRFLVARLGSAQNRLLVAFRHGSVATR